MRHKLSKYNRISLLRQAMLRSYEIVHRLYQTHMYTVKNEGMFYFIEGKWKNVRCEQLILFCKCFCESLWFIPWIFGLKNLCPPCASN